MKNDNRVETWRPVTTRDQKNYPAAATLGYLPYLPTMPKIMPPCKMSRT